jgi:hypothetical protein
LAPASIPCSSSGVIKDSLSLAVPITCLQIFGGTWFLFRESDGFIDGLDI